MLRAEICCLGCKFVQLLWPRVVLKKWLNLNPGSSEYCADSENEEFDYDDADSDISDVEGNL